MWAFCASVQLLDPAHRQRFLAEQGYAYRIVDADDILSGELPPL